MKRSTRNNILIILLIAAMVMLTSGFFVDKGIQLTYVQGETWNYPRLRAPFDVPIEYDSITKLAIRDSIEERFVPFYCFDNDTRVAQLDKLDNALMDLADVNTRTRVQIMRVMEGIYDDGIVENDVHNLMAHSKLPQVRMLEGNEAHTVATTTFRSQREAFTHLDTLLSTPEQQQALKEVAISQYLVPNVIYDTIQSPKYLHQEYATAIVPHGMVDKGDIIIDYGDEITPQRYAIIQKYEAMMQQQSMTAAERLIAMLGKALIVALLMVAFYLFMRNLRPAIFAHFKKMVLLVVCIFVFVMLVFTVTRFRGAFIYLLPFALVPIIVTTFTDSRTGFFVHMVVVLICSLVAQEQAEFIILQFLAGVIAIVSVKELSKRSQLVRGAFFIFVAYSLSYAAMIVARQGALVHVDWHMILFFAINCTVLSMAYFGIFIIEKTFGFTSLMTLVELSDVNNPLLRRLSELCPGTFQHSLQVASLAGEAAHSIGANAQLARTGALYHDIGKMENPAFFTENQKGVNPHDALQPVQSAGIVIAHVTDGLRLAEKAGLPQVVRDFIAQHHGKSRARFFYTAACKAHPGQEVDPAPFTYPGPNPQTAETAIVMMSDACEAACKSLTAPNVESITELVIRVIDNQIASGVLREAPISFKDVGIVKQSLTDRLCTMYQTRVSYPDDVKPAAPASE